VGSTGRQGRACGWAVSIDREGLPSSERERARARMDRCQQAGLTRQREGEREREHAGADAGCH
jgi:hypothetical protein